MHCDGAHNGRTAGTRLIVALSQARVCGGFVLTSTWLSLRWSLQSDCALFTLSFVIWMWARNCIHCTWNWSRFVRFLHPATANVTKQRLCVRSCRNMTQHSADAASCAPLFNFVRCNLVVTLLVVTSPAPCKHRGLIVDCALCARCFAVSDAKLMWAKICCHCVPQCLRESCKLLAISPGATDNNEVCETYFCLSFHSHRACFCYRPGLNKAEGETTQSNSSQTTYASSDCWTSKKPSIVQGLRTRKLNPFALKITRWIFVLSIVNRILRRQLVRAAFVKQARSLPSCRVSEQANSTLLHSKSPGEFFLVSRQPNFRSRCCHVWRVEGVPNCEACHYQTETSQVEIRIHWGIKLVLIQLKRVSFCSSGVGSLTLCVTGLNLIKVVINQNKVV